MSALVGLVVVCAAISGYATVLDRSLPTADRDLEPSTLTAVESALADDSGVVELARLSAGLDACPTGYSCRLVVAVGDERRVAGAEVPDGATTDTASTQVSVRSEPGHVGFGTLRVEVWA